MSEEPKVIDGADRRKKRLLDMLAFIDNCSSEGGVTANQIKGYMLVHFGLRHKTSATYIHEAHLARIITLEGTLWKTTGNYKKLSDDLYS